MERAVAERVRARICPETFWGKEGCGEDGMVELSIQQLYSSIILAGLVGGRSHFHMVVTTIFVVSRDVG